MNTRATTPVVRKTDDILGLAGKYLTFRLANEEYGIEIVKVQEIIGVLPEAKLPLVPKYVRGIINLRGRVIPTINLRTKFGLPLTPDTDKTCTIVVEMKGPAGSHSFGIVVDEVAEVMNVGADQVEAAPDFGATLNSRFIRGVGLIDGAVKILLDIDQVLTDAEFAALREHAPQQLVS